MYKSILMVIDVQEDYTGVTAKAPFPYNNSKELINNINNIIEKSIEKNMGIIYIKQVFRNPLSKLLSKMVANNTAIEGTEGVEIDKRIKIVSDKIFIKELPSALTNKNLYNLLKSEKVEEIFVVGLDAAECVFHTSKNAVKEGYKVYAIKEGLALKDESKWPTVLDKYKENGIKLLSVEEF